MSASLTGVQAKIERSEFHLEEFKTTLRTVWASTAHTAEVVKVEKQTDGERVKYSLTNTDPPPLCGIQIGESVHSLRSALDHLMCQLAIAAGNPAACDRTQFPIFTDDTLDNRKRYR
jgi:hypothetical protein